MTETVETKTGDAQFPAAEGWVRTQFGESVAYQRELPKDISSEIKEIEKPSPLKRALRFFGFA